MRAFIFIVFIISSLLVLYKLLLFLQQTRRKNRHKGLVADWKKFSNKEAFRYSYRIEFLGDKYFEKVVNFPLRYKKGDAITVFFKQNDPNNLIIKDFNDYWSVILKYVFSLVAFVFGIFQMHGVLINPREFAFSNSLTQIGFFVLFLTFLFFGIKMLYRAIEFKKNMVKTVGEIIGFEKKRDIDNILKFKPIVRYEDFMGDYHSFSSSKMMDNKPVIGDRVEIVYDKNLNNIAELNSYYVLWGIPVFCLAFSIISLVVLIVN
jgi:hypothetical protein